VREENPLLYEHRIQMPNLHEHRQTHHQRGLPLVPGEELGDTEDGECRERG